MDNIIEKNKRYLNFFFVLLALGFLAWVSGEVHFKFGKPSETNRDELIQQALEGATQLFTQLETDLITDSNQLVQSIKPLILTQRNEQLYNRISSRDRFFGVTIFRNERQIMWTGNPVSMLPDSTNDDIFVTLTQSGYVLFFTCQITFFDDDDNRFDIVTTRLIRRSGASPVLLTEQIDETTQWARRLSYPVNFRFFDLETTPLPAQKRALHTVSVDSVGFVTASVADFPFLEREWHRSMIRFRYTMLLIGLTLIFLLLWQSSNSLSQPSRLFIQLIGLLSLWVLFILIEIPFPRLLPPSPGTNLLHLSLFGRDALFLSLLQIQLVRILFIHNHRNTLMISLGYIIAGLLGGLIFNEIHAVILKTETGLLSLSVTPDVNSWVVYFGSFIMTASFVLLLFRLIKLNKDSNQKNSFKTFLIGKTFFLIAIFGITYSEVISAQALDVLSFAIVSFLISFIIFISLHNHFNPEQLPVPRQISLVVFATAILAIPCFFAAEIEKEDQEMLRMAINYSQANQEQAETISRVLLQNLANDSGIQQIQTVDAYPTFPIHAAAQFRRRVNQLIEPEWNSYTILAFLLDGRLNVITDFGSQQAFSDRFSSSFYEEVKHFIRQSLQKPFARLPIIESDPRFKGFPVFIKGLQSIPSDFPSQPSWLVTFVLVEGTSFGRPIHDALVFHQRDRDHWNRFMLTEYVDGLKSRTTAAARAPIYPIQHTIVNEYFFQSEERITFRSIREPTPVRQLLYRHDDRTLIIAAVRDQTLLNFIFSGFRYFVALLIICLGIYQFYLLLVGKQIANRQQKIHRLHDRILDNYLLATLLFLVALAFVTEFIVSRQNLTLAEQELSRNLTLLENRIYQMDAGETDIGAFDLMDIDVVLYERGRLSGTSAPEIFRLQLLSDFMPFEAYNRIFNQNLSTVFLQTNVGNLPVIMGFRALFENQEVRRVVAIPAYTRSAAYEEEFLLTTTYLIAFYIIIFVFFTGGAWILSRKLTRPLDAFQSGLKQISAGNLDTMLPVTSNDEIGELAKAYNQMVLDLKNLRQDLAHAEREAAWSEMARQVAHEIKNPLTPMKLSIQHLQRQLLSGERSMDELRPNIERLTTLLVNQIESLSNISSDFSRFAKPLSGTFEVHTLQELVKETSRLFEHHEKVQILLSLPSYDVKVNAIRDEFNRVLINLIKNSIEASEEEAMVSIRIIKDESHAILFLTDQGSGISESDAEKVFAPNFSTKTSGTGLGLAICKKIMEAHKGTISFESIQGKGTTFKLIMPLA